MRSYFWIGVFWLEKKVESVIYAKREENLQLPACHGLAAFQGHIHCFPDGTAATFNSSVL